MKHFTFKWLRRFSVLIAVKLFILALCLTLLRILFISVGDYREHLATWLKDEYHINLSTSSVSAGVDLSGLVVIVNDIELKDSSDLPFFLSSDYLFLHLDFWDSLVEKRFVFSRVSLKGVDLTVKNREQKTPSSEQSLLTLDSLRSIFLQQLNQFSITDSRFHFKNHLGIDKTIIIENLHWLNKGALHQGVGRASLPETSGDNSLQFVIDLSGEKGKQGKLYAKADNLNINDYLLAHVNPDAQINDAVLGFQVWAEFTDTTLNQAQILLNNSQLSWSQAGKEYDWQLNSGLLQLTNNKKGWLFDSYDLDIEHNHQKLTGLAVSGNGTRDAASFTFSDLDGKDLLPFYLLNSHLTQKQSSLLQSLDIGAHLNTLDIDKNKEGKLQFSAQLDGFKNRPQGPIPGLSNAKIAIKGQASQGKINITLPKQKIYFDGQFTRAMPVTSGDITLNWLTTKNGVELFSEQSLLQTTDVDTNTEFSLFFPNKTANNQSPFLSLYTYASLNDGAKAQYYYPVKALGKTVFDYLQPTLKKGTVKGAKILWYGTLNHFPYNQNDGIFQAWVPLRNAQYDFYGKWEGLSDVDADLLFENDSLTVDTLQAAIGEVKVHKLSAQIEHLHPTGMIVVHADVTDDAQKITHYLQNSPLKDSVGNALNVLQTQKTLSGHLQLNIPFNLKTNEPQVQGEVTLLGNELNLHLSDDLIVPLKNVQGKFQFNNGDLTGKDLVAQLFNQKVHVSFDSIQKKRTYQVNVDLDSVWDLQQLSQTLPNIAPLQLSGNLDWTGNIHVKHYFSGGDETRVVFDSATQGITSKLPFPFNKNALQSWPTKVVITADNESSLFKVNIKDKLDFVGQLNYQNKPSNIPYYALKIGTDKLTVVDNNKHIVDINLDSLNISDWYQNWKKVKQQTSLDPEMPDWYVEPDQILAKVKHATFFEQPLTSFTMNALNDQQKWAADFHAHNLQASAEYRAGIPARIDLDIKRLYFPSMVFSSNKDSISGLQSPQSANLQETYPEIVAQCSSCIYDDYNLSPLQVHLYPNKTQLNVDYLKIGDKDDLTQVSGIWDQRRTHVVVNSIAHEHNNIVKRLGFISPIEHEKAELSGAFDWIGAPWQFNFESLNGSFSASAKNGSITEVSDSGARLLSIFSLDAIRQTLNLEFNNVFAKGFNFDETSMTGKIKDGIVKNDDFYLDGSAGKINGSGLIDLPNFESNYKISYSPAVTSSLPVLTAFAVNQLTGAAVLFLAKILAPVVEAVIRVDFSVKGPLNDPEVEVIQRKKGKVKIKNDALLEELNKQAKEN